jgi:hypothetical protein
VGRYAGVVAHAGVARREPGRRGTGARLGLTRMRPPAVKRQTPPRSGLLLFFRRVGLGVVGLRFRALTSFPSSGTDDPCLHQTRLEVLSPWRWPLQRLTSLCALETSRDPHPVLFNREAARLPCAR